MFMFESEADLLETIARHDELVHQCVAKEISFPEFCEKYNSFYTLFALDGHESNSEERLLLEKHEGLIAPHRAIAYEILNRICADEHAELDSYRNAGRIGSLEALELLSNIKLGTAPCTEHQTLN